MPLPDELLLEIFSRLPAKSVGKFRCVSIPWRTLLSTPEFIEKHLNCSRTHHQEHIILISSSQSLHTLTISPKEENFSKEVEFLQGRRWSKFIGSCNGLVLLSDQKHCKFLVNPITHQKVKLPSTLALKKNKSFNMSGFGYDSSSNDYKIVTLSYHDAKTAHELDNFDTFVDLYSLKSGVWKRLESSPYDHAVPYLHSGAFVNGALHWLASCPKSGYQSVIAAFDLVNEVFSDIPAPSGVDKEEFVFNKLVVLEGCLCMMDTRADDWVDLWRMKEYGLEKSWVKFSIIGKCEWQIVKPLCYIEENDVVLQTKEECLIVYDGRGWTFRNMIIDGVEVDFIDGGVFMESLVSPDLREHPLRIDGVLF